MKVLPSAFFTDCRNELFFLLCIVSWAPAYETETFPGLLHLNRIHSNNIIIIDILIIKKMAISNLLLITLEKHAFFVLCSNLQLQVGRITSFD